MTAGKTSERGEAPPGRPPIGAFQLLRLGSGPVRTIAVTIAGTRRRPRPTHPHGEDKSVLSIDAWITALDTAARRWTGSNGWSIHPAAHLMARELLGATSPLAVKE